MRAAGMQEGCNTMALEQISRAVRESAQKEADLILKAAEMAAADQEEQARRAAEAEGERRYQQAARAIEEEYARKLIQFSGAANKELLARKNACLRQIFDVAYERLLKLPDDEYTAIMRRLLDRATRDKDGGPRGGRIRIHPDEKGRFEGILREYNAGRPDDQTLALDAANPLPEPGGFIYVSENFQIDQTLRTLLGDLEREHAPRIAAQIFGKVNEQG